MNGRRNKKYKLLHTMLPVNALQRSRGGRDKQTILTKCDKEKGTGGVGEEFNSSFHHKY